MDSKTYQEQAGVTDVDDYSEIRSRLNTEKNAKILHYVLGIGTEAGELQDAVKKHLIYGKELDEVNLIEEVSDIFWYSARLLTLLDSSFEEAMEKNIAKLRARYGDKFTEHAALNRDLVKERNVLENK